MKLWTLNTLVSKIGEELLIKSSIFKGWRKAGKYAVVNLTGLSMSELCHSDMIL